MKHTHSKNSLFLLELILNLLLFVLLMIVSLQLVIRAHTLTNETRNLHQAVTCCASAASVFESGDGTLDDFLEHYRCSVNQNSRIIIYLDADFEECPFAEAAYYLTVTVTGGDDAVDRATITCLTMQDEPIYSLTACHYGQRRLAGTPGKEVRL